MVVLLLVVLKEGVMVIIHTYRSDLAQNEFLRHSQSRDRVEFEKNCNLLIIDHVRSGLTLN